MRTVQCKCGAVIPHRQVYDYYQLTPRYAAVREKRRLGVRRSWLKRFMDQSEAATRRGEPVLRFADMAPPEEERYARRLTLLRRCKSAGYLEYVCPHCERPLIFQRKRRRRV